MATLLASALAVGAHHLANLSGRRVEPILLGSFVFLQGRYPYPCMHTQIIAYRHLDFKLILAVTQKKEGKK